MAGGTLKLTLLLAGACILASATGCAAANKIHNTQVIVQFSTEEVLHVACVPTVLPDGEPASAQRAALLEAVAKAAGGYTLIEDAMGGWVPPGTRTTTLEVNDLLLVKGPPELMFLLEQRLREDFGQDYPFIISLPVLPVATVVPPPAETEGAAEEARGLGVLSGPWEATPEPAAR